MIMSAKRLKVAVVCSGGDSPGMNAFLRGATRLGINRYDAEVIGVKDGYCGLARVCGLLRDGRQTVEDLQRELTQFPGRDGLHRLEQELVVMDHPAVDGILGRGGVILGSGRCPEFHDAGCRRAVADLLDRLEIGAVIVCGGDGSLTGASLLAAESNVQVIGVPATIDNDVAGTETALGVDTAVNTLMAAVENCNDTAFSHHRVMVLETMGRHSGELARLSAMAAGAEIVVTPERGLLTEEKMGGIAERLEGSIRRGRQHGIVIVAEGVETDSQLPTGAAHELGAFLERYFNRLTCPIRRTDVRVNVIGHLQRGGRPTAADRILAAEFAEQAWETIIADEAPSGVLGKSNGRIGLERFQPSQNRSVMPSAERRYALQKSLSKW